jgi:hypothetical protein
MTSTTTEKKNRKPEAQPLSAADLRKAVARLDELQPKWRVYTQDAEGEEGAAAEHEGVPGVRVPVRRDPAFGPDSAGGPGEGDGVTCRKRTARADPGDTSGSETC